MQVIQENNLFIDISATEAAAVSGGGLRELLTASSYLTVFIGLTGTPVSDVTRNTVLLFLIGALSVPGFSPLPSVLLK
jgi:hypothetical protein